MRAVSLFNNACREQIGEKIGRDQITVLLPCLHYDNHSIPHFEIFETGWVPSQILKIATQINIYLAL